MSDSRVDGDEQIQVHQHRRRIHEIIQIRREIRDRKRCRGDLRTCGLFLQTEKLDVFPHLFKWSQGAKRNRPRRIIRVPGISRPHQPDAQPFSLDAELRAPFPDAFVRHAQIRNVRRNLRIGMRAVAPRNVEQGRMRIEPRHMIAGADQHIDPGQLRHERPQ